MKSAMKKLILLLLVIVAFTACQESGSKANVRTAGGAISAEDEQADLQAMLKERRSYGSLFDSIITSFNNDWGIDLDLFNDYVDGSGDYDGSLFADIRDMFSFGRADNSGDEFFY